MLDHTVFWANLWMPGSMYHPLNPWVQNFGFSGFCCYPTKTCEFISNVPSLTVPGHFCAKGLRLQTTFKVKVQDIFIYIYLYQIMPQQSLKDIEYSNLKLPPLGAWIPSFVCNADGLMFEFDFEDLGSEGEAKLLENVSGVELENWQGLSVLKISKNSSNYSCIIIVSLANWRESWESIAFICIYIYIISL